MSPLPQDARPLPERYGQFLDQLESRMVPITRSVLPDLEGMSAKDQDAACNSAFWAREHLCIKALQFAIELGGNVSDDIQF